MVSRRNYKYYYQSILAETEINITKSENYIKFIILYCG